MSASVFHIGEQQVQARLGVSDMIEPWAKRVVRTWMPEEHQRFYPQLPFVAAAARDNSGRPWVTLLAGPPGFIQAPDERSLVFNTRPLPGDALEGTFTAGAELGLLGIELDTRRRNRVNGTLTQIGAKSMRFEVGQAFGNCPQYITERSWYEVAVDHKRSNVSHHKLLNADMRVWIGSADTFFIASGYRGEGDSEAFGMDASHRGGSPGFVKVESDTRLVLPDYAGNNHFNTIGNLIMDPGVGLLFVDFERGSLLQITGTATIDWDSDAVAQHTGAQRLIVIDVDEIVHLDGVLPLRWNAPQGSVRSLRVARKIVESDDVVSLELIARDGGELPDFAAGQHLPIELKAKGETNLLKRTYSLSNAPGYGRYRISVKREPKGQVSNLLHDVVKEGDIINSMPPAGDFTLKYSVRPVVLISAGIGVTPMVSMLHQLINDGSERQVTFIHGARDSAHHALAEEVRELATDRPEIQVHVTYSRPDADHQDRDYDRPGRVNGDMIRELVTDLDADFYICGPISFMAAINAALDDLNVSPERIYTESFGPSALPA